ncbi:MotA/TolQ/ExbB proton channel family protein [Vibrio metoecus]|uniref:MotA/TolQ/ExbB proton channel family protein n=1 Tax=Vibrio metoecus TaxID=1481663 RepID=UPI00300CC151
MESLQQLQQQLGLIAWPLFICSALTVMLLAERLFQVLLSLTVGKGAIRQALDAVSPNNPTQLAELTKHFTGKRPVLYRGVAMLLAHHQFEKSLREDAAGIWLQEQRHQFNSGLRLLTLIGVISPLLGLLGTVLGLIDMFKGVAATTGSITPNVLADGLGIAMYTTAAGLMIAVPAVAGAQLLNLWADRTMAKLEHSLNYVNLWLEGMPLHTNASISVVYPQTLTVESND